MAEHVDLCETEHPDAGCADVGCAHNCQQWAEDHPAEQTSSEGGEGLSEAERESLGLATAGLSSARNPLLIAAVERILADRLATAHADGFESYNHGHADGLTDSEAAFLSDAIADQRRNRRTLYEQMLVLRAERDDLRARVAAVEALADEWSRTHLTGFCTSCDQIGRGDRDAFVADIRAALANPSADQ